MSFDILNNFTSKHIWGNLNNLKQIQPFFCWLAIQQVSTSHSKHLINVAFALTCINRHKTVIYNLFLILSWRLWCSGSGQDGFTVGQWQLMGIEVRTLNLLHFEPNTLPVITILPFLLPVFIVTVAPILLIWSLAAVVSTPFYFHFDLIRLSHVFLPTGMFGLVIVMLLVANRLRVFFFFDLHFHF